MYSMIHFLFHYLLSHGQTHHGPLLPLHHLTSHHIQTRLWLLLVHLVAVHHGSDQVEMVRTATVVNPFSWTSRALLFLAVPIVAGWKLHGARSDPKLVNLYLSILGKIHFHHCQVWVVACQNTVWTVPRSGKLALFSSFPMREFH